MDYDVRYEYLRKKLDLLGYGAHQLPLSSVALVSSIVDDLISTTQSLKNSKDELAQLLEEKKAWELGNEVYKCDNSKLLQDVNRLKLELLNNERKVQIENADLKRKLRSLEVDKKTLDEKCAELNQHVMRLNQSDKGKKHIKPFVSTVRSNAPFPEISNDDTPCGCKSAIATSASTTNKKVLKEIEKLKNDLKYAQELNEVYKKQESEKDREIQRLSCLFIGGRPVSALAKDCCYKDVSKFSEDINHLQHDKIDLIAKLAEYEDRHEKIYQKWKQQRDKIRHMDAYLKEISEAALYVEREANLRIKNQNRDIAELKENLNKNVDGTKIKEIKELKRTLKEKNKQEQKLLFEIEYIKNKLNEHEKNSSSKNSDLVAELVRERDDLQNKLKNMCESQGKNSSCNTNQHYCNMQEKEAEIARLKDEICNLQMASSHTHQSHGAAGLTVTNSLRRAECERDCALNKLQSLKMDIVSLQDKVKVMQDTKISDNKKIIKLEENLSKLKLEIQDLHTSKTPAFATIKQLREENCELQIKLRTAGEDYQKLNCTYNQIKMLTQQTENVLMNVQNQLEFTKCELSERDAQICCLNKSNDCLKDQVEKLSADISKIKSEKCTVEREKEFYMMTLDRKNEKLQTVESRVETAMCLKTTNQKMKTQIDDLNCEIKRLESILCDTRSENKCLCKQLETTKHHLTNAIHENGRMADELASITAELNATKKCLVDSQRESENIRSKLQSYIKEIEQVNDIISMKDNDRKQTLCQFKDLECQFKSLDQESSESKRMISEYQQKVKVLSDALHSKEIDIETLEKQLIDMSTEVELIRNENMKLYMELEAQKNLCDKLDVQKEKQKAEIIEYQMSVKELLQKNDKLHETILILRENGGGGDTHVSASYHPTM